MELDSTSPAPRPGGGCPQANARMMSAQNTADKIRFITLIDEARSRKLSFVSMACPFWRVIDDLLMNVFVQQLDLVALLA
jgi:hypothetical protein